MRSERSARLHCATIGVMGTVALIERVALRLRAVTGLRTRPQTWADDAVCKAQAEERAAALARDPRRVAGYLDHTLLKPDATPDQITNLCQEAKQAGFASVCVNPRYVPQCVQVLRGSPVAVGTVADFPLGATTTASKVFEADHACGQGAHEVDMVLAVGLLKAGDYATVLDDITQVVATCHQHRALCKVILETALLSDAEKVAAALLAIGAHADFVKTSTGFASGGATVQDVALLRAVVGTAAGIKAAGGIRSFDDARAMVAAGATRIGASASMQIVQGSGPPVSASSAGGHSPG